MLIKIKKYELFDFTRQNRNKNSQMIIFRQHSILFSLKKK